MGTRDLVDTFYTALAQRDADAMVACYRDEVIFEDPVFGELTGGDACDMWRMLCSSDTDLRVEHTILAATETAASANWVAHYTFSATGRAVRNDVTATMRIEDGRIVDHRDHFDLWSWASQALGLPGKLLGWSPPLKAKVRKTALASLADYQAEHPSR